MSDRATYAKSVLADALNNVVYRRRLLAVASLIVALITIYLLVLPAVTLANQTFCGYEEHVHSDGCNELVLVCNLEESEDYVGHAHSDACYEAETVLVCGLEEGAVEVADSGLEEGFAGDDNSDATEGASEPENSVGHAHSDACYAEQRVLVCSLEEGEGAEAGHTHNAACYESVLACNLPEHEHTVVCYADASADVETAPVWEATLPADDELTGNWADDVLAVAESQLGYKESDANYVVDDDGTTKGYTRYGEWYGDAYGDWCAMFVSFCLHYAHVAEELMPQDANCQNWIETLSDEEGFDYYVEVDGEFTPMPGDLVFFDWDADGVSDHVGIVLEYVAATEDAPAKVKTIEGNASDAVAECEYVFDDQQIMGYAMLPANPLEVAQVLGDTVYYCGYVDEHAHDDVTCLLVNSTCIFPEHTHTDDCLIAPEVYCDKTAHAHTASCYDADGELICALAEHEHVTNCTYKFDESLPGINSASGSLAGETVYHSPVYTWHQISEHMLQGNQEATTFVLVPDGLWSEDWLPNTREWNAKADANYIVAYCADGETYATSSGADYETYTIDNSRFTSEDQQRKLSAIVGHAYPFITEAEMKAQLKAAYENGEMSIDVSECCVASDFIMATQWAIWETNSEWKWWDDYVSNYYADYDGDGVKEPSFYKKIQDKCLAPLSDVGHTDANLDPHVKVIRDWLLSLQDPEYLEVESFSHTLTQQEDTTYTLTVGVTLNRAILTGETAKFALTVGTKTSEYEAMEVGEKTFTITLGGIEPEDVANAEVLLAISGEHMQAYFFDSPNWQDMIGGKWEEYTNDLSFSVGIESTSVSVKKVWTEENMNIESVTVQLYANGEKCGDPVVLNDTNDWGYCWEALPKKDVTGKEHEYTVVETPVPGYYSSLASYDGSTSSTIRQWKQVDHFENGGKYLIVARGGALNWKWHEAKSDYWITWSTVNPADASSGQSGAIWTATAKDAEDPDAGLLLYNAAIERYMSGGYTIRAATSSTTTYTLVEPEKGSANGQMYLMSSSGYYLEGHAANGVAVCTSDTADAMLFTVYQLVDVEVPEAGTNFVLTNTKLDSSSGEECSITVTKQWAARPDGAYPAEVTVQLMQDGRAYGDPVVLTASEDWTHTWSNLPASWSTTDENGDVTESEITYTVKELDVDGYDSVCTADPDDSTSLTLTNTWAPAMQKITMQKVDSFAADRLLAGAEFDVYLESNDADEGVYVGPEAANVVEIPGADGALGVKVDSIVVGSDGTTEIELAAGETYYLVETKAPDGYNTLPQAIGITVTKRGTSTYLDVVTGNSWVMVESGASPVITVKNDSGYELPETGGIGTIPFIAGGLLLIAAAGLVLHRRRRVEGARV